MHSNSSMHISAVFKVSNEVHSLGEGLCAIFMVHESILLFLYKSSRGHRGRYQPPCMKDNIKRLLTFYYGSFCCPVCGTLGQADRSERRRLRFPQDGDGEALEYQRMACARRGKRDRKLAAGMQPERHLASLGTCSEQCSMSYSR